MPPIAPHSLIVASLVLMACAAQAAATPPPPIESSGSSAGPSGEASVAVPLEDGQARYNRAMRDKTIRYYPKAAQKAGLSGRSVLDCSVDAQGWLRDCKVASEQPADLGFGQAALRMAPLFRMNAPASDARAQIPITFKLPK